MHREITIEKYFRAWLQKDPSELNDIFHRDAVYIESYGPAYNGLEEIRQWFEDWNKAGTVLRWEIKQYAHDGQKTVCEWYFECNYKGNTDGFNGVSWITFDRQGKIRELKEFASKTPNYYPYAKKQAS